jgi:hypothetical protein
VSIKEVRNIDAKFTIYCSGNWVRCAIPYEVTGIWIRHEEFRIIDIPNIPSIHVAANKSFSLKTEAFNVGNFAIPAFEQGGKMLVKK